MSTVSLWAVSTTSGTLRRVRNDPAIHSDPKFTRDGKSMLRASTRSGHFEVWMAETDAAAPGNSQMMGSTRDMLRPRQVDG